MTPEQARGQLLAVIENGRISMGGGPLTGRELMSLQQAVLYLYGQAKERQENGTDKEEKVQEKPDERKKQ